MRQGVLPAGVVILRCGSGIKVRLWEPMLLTNLAGARDSQTLY